ELLFVLVILFAGLLVLLVACLLVAVLVLLAPVLVLLLRQRLVAVLLARRDLLLLVVGAEGGVGELGVVLRLLLEQLLGLGEQVLQLLLQVALLRLLALHVVGL